jgi:predicted nucleic acid-binding protein
VTKAFLDANILVYYLTQNHEEYSRRSTTLMDALGNCRTTAVCASTAILEAIYGLDKAFQVPKAVTHRAMKAIVQTPAISFDHREALVEALDYWHGQGPLSITDCYHLALAKSLGLDAIYSFDRKMGRYPGVERLEP